MRADHHFMLAFEGPDPDRRVLDALASGDAPGVTLFRHANVESAAQVAALTERLEAANGSGQPLLVAADQETGQLMGLGPDTTPFAGSMALGATGDPDLARRVAAAVGRELRALGVTMNYAPVCDVATNPANPSLGIRSFSDDPQLVSEMVAATVAGYADAGVAGVAKHFPGEGEAVVDPHHELPLLDVDRGRLDTVELAPFRSAIAAGVPAVMSGHYAVPAVTGRHDLPSTVSSDMIGGLLRGELGFDGVVISDALDMGALPQGVGQIVDAVAAVAAGIDLLLCIPDPDGQERLRAGLDLAVSRGLIGSSGSRERVLALRRWVARFEPPSPGAVASSEHRRLAAELARRSITLVRDGGVLPLPREGTVLAVMPRPEDLTPADTSSTVPPSLASSLRRHHPDVVEIVTSHRPTSSDVAGVVAAARDADVVVMGTLHAGDEQADMVASLLSTERAVVTVAMRTPFDLARYPEASTHLCTYSILEPSMQALADVIFGAAEAPGRLPAAIPGLHPTGWSAGD